MQAHCSLKNQIGPARRLSHCLFAASFFYSSVPKSQCNKETGQMDPFLLRAKTVTTGRRAAMLEA
jgi:hypothetical protein